MGMDSTLLLLAVVRYLLLRSNIDQRLHFGSVADFDPGNPTINILSMLKLRNDFIQILGDAPDNQNDRRTRSSMSQYFRQK